MNLRKCYQCSGNIEISPDLKVYFSLVTCKIKNLIALCSTNQLTEISAPWWLCEILPNMCIVIVYKPGCDVINFEINLNLLIKLFFLRG